MLLAAALLAPAASHASKTQESVFQDDATLLYGGDAKRDQALDELQRLGVHTVRVNVRWNRYAPSPTSATRPAFDAGDPWAYPGFGEIDALVSGAERRGIQVLLTPTGPGPGWASRCKGSYETRRICKPSPGEFGQFVAALGRRYPTVTRWSVWNEPNQGGWLTPQYEKHGGKYVPWSPVVYRELVRSAAGALQGTGHGGDQLLLGETAPLGKTSGSYHKRSMPPALFYRELFCLDSKGRGLTGSAARTRGCASYPKLPVTGVAHHPYTRGAAGAPRSRPSGSSDITLATISRLSLWVDRGANRGRVPRGLPIWLTEYGFQTNPPDRYGTSLTNQAAWLNESDWMAWNNSRIRSTAQYELYDERSSASGFQTGLRFKDGKAKPALAAYRLPIWPVATRTYTKLWLHVRPAREPQAVTIQYLPKGKSAYRTLGTYTTDANGFAYVKTRTKAPYWRFTWNGATSRKAKPASR
jgi:hypothetical protein